MSVRFHRHALGRMEERGATEEEERTTIEQGERFPAKSGRTGFRRSIRFDDEWRGRYHSTKQVEAFAAQEGPDWLVIMVITRCF